MKNTKLFPFERNHYYYGKLLSAEDFELEQRYVNDKRRLLSRLLDGCGVVAGLSVVDIDEQTISIESGVAIDAYGREIVVDKPFVRTLSDIDGFATESKKGGRYVYLCIEYDEEETDRAFNIADEPVPKNAADYSHGHIRENFHLYLTAQEPLKHLPAAERLYEQETTFHPVEDVTIRHIVPRFVQAGRSARIHIHIENLGRRNLSFSYDLILNHLESAGQPRIHVTFDEMLFERTGSYDLYFPVGVSDTEGENAVVAVDPESVKLSLSGQLAEAALTGEVSAQIVRRDVMEEVTDYHFRTAMEELVTRNSEAIYLAKVFLVRAADTFLIERIAGMPFGQYIYSGILADASMRLMREGIPAESSGQEGKKSPEAKAPERELSLPIARGVCEIALSAPAKRGDRFFSGDIIHGLGIGDVTVTLGMEKLSGHVVYGSSEVYEQSREKGIDAELAAAVNPANGSFTIGLRLIAETAERVARVHWTAMRDPAEKEADLGERKLFIRPNVLELSVREAYTLETVCENMAEKAVRWSVQEHGGTVDEHGLYTAPGVPGVYEVMAQSIAFPEVRASIYVLVREES